MDAGSITGMCAMTGRTPWTVLGLTEDAPDAEIDRSFRRMVKVTHPDHGGDASDFDRVVRSYHALRLTRSRRQAHRTCSPLSRYQRWLSTADPVVRFDSGPTTPCSPAEPADARLRPADFAAVLHDELSRIGSGV